MAGNGIPTWVKIVLAVSGVVAGIVIVYEVVVNVFGAGVGAYKQLYQQQYDALLKKMAGYVKTNGSTQTGFTATQQQAINVETAQLAQTSNGLAATANGLTNALVESIIGVSVTVVLGAVGFSALKAWLAKTGQKAATSYSITYGTTRVIADELSNMGYTTQSANLITSAQTMFAQLSQPAMMQYQAALQADLANLVGAELLAAQQTIALLSAEMAYIPTMLAEPIILP